jgi:2-oxoglutarate ferredoxin oxidoreductase subunit alpha
MQADPKGVLTGVHFLDGDHACCEGALAAGARFAAGYPITPSTEVVERFAARIPTIGGIFRWKTNSPPPSLSRGRLGRR